MTETVPFPNWESFYVFVGSSAGALTGLQFVVMALIADTRAKASPEIVGAFGTPTIVHFWWDTVTYIVVGNPKNEISPTEAAD